MAASGTGVGAPTDMRLQGITDLTLLAPIKQGLVESLDTCSYETRLRTLMKTLNALRVSSREYSLLRPFSDAVERIQAIHSFRLAILGEGARKQLLLAVTFDSGFEPYIRVIWRDLGTLLDVIFCNCEGYKSAFEHSFEEYATWVRSSQVDGNFFYAASGLTVADLQYLRQVEKLHREQRDPRASDLAAAKLVGEDPEQVALRTAQAHPEQAANLGLAALTALYRLTDTYPPDRPDGKYLLRASHELLRELRALDTRRLFSGPKRNLFKAQLEWFEQAVEERAPRAQERLRYGPESVQSGILATYDRPSRPITHGCMVLMEVVDAPAARAFLRGLRVSSEASGPGDDGIHLNVALSFQGLRKLGVPDAELRRFPAEFREGMEARSSLLGDFRLNHPRHWALPERNWPDRAAENGIGARVQLSTVDIVLQLRTHAERRPGDHEIIGNAEHPLYEKVTALSGVPGVRILSVQAMLHHLKEDGSGSDHLDFVDGISQPVVAEGRSGNVWDDGVKRGEILCGYVNDRSDPPLPTDAGSYLDNGTFLVVRKLRLDVKALYDTLDAQLEQLARGEPAVSLSREALLSRMIGRKPDGQALAAPGLPPHNDFDYRADPGGALCPFQAHIRRANPRTPGKAKLPRIMRRGMSYGPRFSEDPEAERGLMFMAYNASIAEQFEVIQRWISGGNSSGVFSGQGDPLLGVPQAGDARTFRFVHDGKVVRVDLGGEGERPFVRLEWGAYYFVPSPQVIERIAALTAPQPGDHAARGKEIIDKLLTLEGEAAKTAWKTYLEDFAAKENGDTAAIWSAIRQHGGALWTPYGVLVASKALVDEVFLNQDGRYSVKGYMERMDESIGKIYLGLDAGADYDQQSAATNAAIRTVKEADAFAPARALTSGFLDVLLTAAEQETGKREIAVDVKSISDQVLGRLCEEWFGLPNGQHMVRGGWGWEKNRKPHCPGDFTSPSRFIFSPHPVPAAQGYGRSHGKRLEQSVKQFVVQMRNQVQNLKPLSAAMFAAIADDDRLARTIVGVMMGFLPTVDGNLRSTLYEWLKDQSLWRLQHDLASHQAGDRYEAAKAILKPALKRTMQQRPVPDIVWRTAVKEHRLGGVAVNDRDPIVVGIVSATQEDLAAGKVDVSPVFGGDRGADPAPTHACPGYEMGMGVLLGIISGLLEAGTLRPTPAPLILTLTGSSATGLRVAHTLA